MRVAALQFLLASGLWIVSAVAARGAGAENAQCATAQRAPLRIAPPFKPELNALRMVYAGARNFTAHNAGNRLSLLSDGPLGFADYHGGRYVAELLDMRSPAEHVVGKTRPPLEMQLYHHDSNSGKTLAVSLLFTVGGSRSSFMDRVLFSLRRPTQQVHPVALLDLGHYFRHSGDYFAYSSTAGCGPESWGHPPIDRWVVMSKMKRISAAQLAELRRRVPSLAKTTRAVQLRQKHTEVASTRAARTPHPGRHSATRTSMLQLKKSEIPVTPAPEQVVGLEGLEGDDVDAATFAPPQQVSALGNEIPTVAPPPFYSLVAQPAPGILPDIPSDISPSSLVQNNDNDDLEQSFKQGWAKYQIDASQTPAPPQAQSSFVETDFQQPLPQQRYQPPELRRNTPQRQGAVGRRQARGVRSSVRPKAAFLQQPMQQLLQSGQYQQEQYHQWQQQQQAYQQQYQSAMSAQKDAQAKLSNWELLLDNENQMQSQIAIMQRQAAEAAANAKNPQPHGKKHASLLKMDSTLGVAAGSPEAALMARLQKLTSEEADLQHFGRVAEQKELQTQAEMTGTRAEQQLQWIADAGVQIAKPKTGSFLDVTPSHPQPAAPIKKDVKVASNSEKHHEATMATPTVPGASNDFFVPAGPGFVVNHGAK